ncbi:MAG TPA: hypothetical protein VF013_08440 [Candidatus Limnocylindria bacterium]
MNAARLRERGSVAPSFLDPVLAVVERVDRGLRHIRPVQPGGILGLERRRHRGARVVLTDGTEVRRGDPVGVVHLDNALVAARGRSGWQTDSYGRSLADLAALAAQHAALSAAERPVAYTGVTLLAAFARRAGFEVRARSRSWRVRLDDWYLRSLLARWAGRERLARGHRPLATREVWLSGTALLGRYGSAPPPE